MKLSNYQKVVQQRVLMTVGLFGAAFEIYLVVVGWHQIAAGKTALQLYFWLVAAVVVLSLIKVVVTNERLQDYSISIKPGLPLDSKWQCRQAGVAVLRRPKRCILILPRGWKLREVPRYASNAYVLDNQDRLRLSIEAESWYYACSVVPRFEIRLVMDAVGITGHVEDNAVGKSVWSTRTYKSGEAMTDDELRRAAHEEVLRYLAVRGIQLGHERSNWRRKFIWEDTKDTANLREVELYTMGSLALAAKCTLCHTGSPWWRSALLVFTFAYAR